MHTRASGRCSWPLCVVKGMLYCNSKKKTKKTSLTILRHWIWFVACHVEIRIQRGVVNRSVTALINHSLLSLLIFICTYIYTSAVALPPVLGHGLPDHLPPAFCRSCCRLPVPCLERIYGVTLKSIISSTSRFHHWPSFSEISITVWGIREPSIRTTWPAHYHMFRGLYVRRISTVIIVSFYAMYSKPFKSSLNK